MRSLFLPLLLILALLSGPAEAKTEGLYAITDVTVVPMDSERLVPGQTVIVRDGRIAAIQPSRRAAIPAGSTIIDGSGRFLMPGLAEMHAHIPPDPADAQWTRDVLFLYAANGITFARGMLGAPHHLELRRQAEAGAIVSPRIYASGPSLNGNSVTSPEDGRRMVAAQKAAGYDTLKIHPGLDRPRYDAIAVAAREAGMPFGGHVPTAVGLARTLEVRQATVDHLDGYMELLLRDGAPANLEPGFFGYGLVDHVDVAKIPAVVAKTREAGVWNVPTDSLIQHILLPEPSAADLERREEMRYVPRPMLEQWKQARAALQGQPSYDPQGARRFAKVRATLIKALHDGGAGLLLGSDAPQWFNVPGFSLHRELDYLVNAGLTPYQALSTGTRNVARFLGQADDFGTVQVGRRADLLLLEANPLVDVGNVRSRAGVMIDGRWLAEDRIRAGLAEIAARHRE